MIFQINVTHGEVICGGVNDNDVVEYPVAITQATPDFVYAIFMGSKDTNVKTDLEGEDIPNLTSGGIREYDDEFYLVVKRYYVEVSHAHPAKNPPNAHTDWDSKAYETDKGGARPSGMAFANNGSTLVVVGNTRNLGGPFEESDGSDMDGWILKIDPNTGELSEQGGKSSTRVDSSNSKDDWVTVVCADPTDSDTIYIVSKPMGNATDLSDDQQLPECSTSGRLYPCLSCQDSSLCTHCHLVETFYDDF